MPDRLKPPGPFRDIAARLPDWRPTTIFDVGANRGQSALAYAAAFPDVPIHSFEPIPATFDALCAATASCANVTAYRIALGKAPGVARMAQGPSSVSSRVVAGEAVLREPAVEVEMETGAAFAARHGIGAISFLKIDTEGSDYDVLIGFVPMMERIDFIQVEAAMNPYNRTHVAYRLLEDFLLHQGFYLFKFYEQVLEFKRGGRPVLRRTNPVFINGSLVDLKGIS